MKTIDCAALMRDTRQIGIRLGLDWGRALAREGITGAQAQMLLHLLHRGDGVSLTTLHRDTGFSMAALSGQLKQLRQQGYIRAEPCPGDDRRKFFYATEKSRRLRETLDAALERTQRQLYRGFSEEDLCTLDALQKRMLQNLSGCGEAISKEVTNL